MDIKRSKGIALYHQLEKILINLINNDHLKENDKLPSERELCETYNVSRTTARQAVAELEKKGYIYKVHGKGTFVSPKVYKQQLLKFYSFTEEMKKLNKVPSSKILSFNLIDADEIIASKLKLNENLKVYKITRLRLAENEPMMVEITYLPETRFKNLSVSLLKKEPMYDIFREKYNVNITKAIESFKPILIDKVEAIQLEVKQGTAAMNIERITFENLEVIEYTTSIARGDKFEYTVSLE
ncbi:GntR family transcriptional regulator [Clostridium tarantellae]|uniref:UTRA domain-containing protein n=1 Tax=Clostridium tarantellae TaxID=39493 RepID=A0A6I1ML45_9CLOT|nr:GntR family transcriptional regulator [Clostridium tarantellae]MPQ43740.1 UTRA domain-containing protein [Clostridium tarantellae]